MNDARRAWEARALSAWRNTTRGTLCFRVELPLDLGELVLKAIERALEKEEIPDGVAEGSPTGFQCQRADALVAIAKTYLDGGAAKSAADSSSRPIAISSSCMSTKQPPMEGRGAPTRRSKR